MKKVYLKSPVFDCDTKYRAYLLIIYYILRFRELLSHGSLWRAAYLSLKSAIRYRKIKLYASCPVQPSIEATTNAFRIVLPNMNAASAGAENAAEAKPAAPIITPQMKIVLDYLKEYGEMHDEDLQELLHIKKTRAYLLTRQMSEEGLIEVVGRGTEKKYKFKQ